ncbi:hypothetical protein ABL78_3246 [Leptomonas seymouri]|uniref:GOLD domain-containing protein n=1 Tax=Leptomonas seymouri TaxID=5684 RepID=A0A0N1PCV9_LEPSE|nr:hypothetical protein ABL78_3246 [Leptomonas seymouri]|eukprot:KPI87648.1 hypothetical protein ABL78_3246 [Leptomonas seymouri]
MKDSTTAVCMLLALDNGLGGVIRFTYSSNLADIQQRADVLVSIHKPLPSAPSIAALDSVENVVEKKLFSATDLGRMDADANTAPRNTEHHENGVVSRSFTLTVRPAQEGTGAGARFLDGNYAACFRLLRQPRGSTKNQPPAPEEVQIQLLEVASTSHSTSTYIARLNNPAVNVAGNGQVPNSLISEADREYAKMIRMMFRASNNTDLRSLLDVTAVVTSQEMQQQLDALKAVQKQLFALYANSEQLEERYSRMRVTAESTFTRIWVCMLTTVLVMGSAIWLTFHFTKDIIVKRKLI